MRILVLGGNGFIGRHFVDLLAGTDNEVRILARNLRRDQINSTNVEQVEGDYLDKNILEKSLDQVDIVVHLISTTVPKTAQQDFAYDLESNLIGTIRLVETMLSRGINRMIFLSSGGTVYGIPKTNPVNEKQQLDPINAYGITKVAIEHSLNMYRKLYGLEPVILRVANPYGEGPVKSGLQGIIGNFLQAINENRKLVVFGDGNIVRDYVYVGDVATALMLALDSPACTYNIGSGIGRSINDVIQTLGQVTGRDLQVEHRKANPYDVPALILDSGLAHERLGWTPTVEFETGIRHTWDWVQSR